MEKFTISISLKVVIIITTIAIYIAEKKWHKVANFIRLYILVRFDFSWTEYSNWKNPLPFAPHIRLNYKLPWQKKLGAIAYKNLGV